jgi:hypothetical protein
LGIPKSAVLDGWSNFFTYRVSVSSPAAAAPAAPLVPRAANNLQNWAQRNLVPPPNAGFNIGSLTSPNTGGFRAIQVDERNAGIVSTSAFHAVATLVSHGPSGAGARTSNGVLMALPPAGSDELIQLQQLAVYMMTSWCISLPRICCSHCLTTKVCGEFAMLIVLLRQVLRVAAQPVYPSEMQQ